MHGLFGAWESLSVVLNKHIFCCSEMYSCLHEKGWGTNVMATKHKEVPCPSETCYEPEFWKQHNSVPWFGKDIIFALWGGLETKRFCHFSIAWNELSGLICKPNQLQPHWWYSYPPYRSQLEISTASVLVPFSPACRRIVRVSAAYSLPVTWGVTDMWAWRNTLFGQIIRSLFFWPLEAKRLGISLAIWHFLAFFFLWSYLS